MRNHQRADSVLVRSDEDGAYLLVETEDGDELRFDLSASVAKSLAFEQTLPIRLHWQEGEFQGSIRPSTTASP